jgi:Fic family protein
MLDMRIRKLHDEIEETRKKLSYGTQLRRWTGVLARVMLARAIQGSNSIEGYNVTIDDAIAAADGEAPMDQNPQLETWNAITGYRDAMTYSLKLSDDPHFEHSAALIRSLHYMIQKYDQTKHPGQWRKGPIFVRNEATGETVYEGPSAELIPDLMTEFIASLTTPPSDGIPPMVRGAMAHLNLVMIHPFADGNGRMGRCLQTLVLAREGILAPQFCSIEEYLGRYRQEYYDVLARVGAGAWHPERDATPWIEFCLEIHTKQASTLLRRTRELGRLWEALERLARENELPERTVSALADAALGLRVRNGPYRQIAEVSRATATADLNKLVEAELLVAVGKNPRISYFAGPMLRALREQTRDPSEPLVGPKAPRAEGQQAALPGFWDGS